MSILKELQQRSDVPNRDIDDIIGIASELQEEARRSRGASVSDVEAVAEELDIDPAYVEEAIGVLQDRRRAEEEARALQGMQRRKLVRVAGIVAGGVLLLLVGLTLTGAARLSSAHADVQSAQVQLDTVLQRQASLAPQLVALAGGNASGLLTMASAVGEGPMTSRIQASDRLSAELARRLGALPAAVGESQRANLQHELTGAANRITVERRRLAEAQVAYDRVASGMSASLARGLGCRP